MHVIIHRPHLTLVFPLKALIDEISHGDRQCNLKCSTWLDRAKASDGFPLLYATLSPLYSPHSSQSPPVRLSSGPVILQDHQHEIGKVPKRLILSS